MQSIARVAALIRLHLTHFRNRIPRLSLLGVVLLAGLTVPRTADSQDWPHWMGPTRDNVWHATNLIDRFPTQGLEPIWRTEIRAGYAGPAVGEGRVIVTDFQKIENATSGELRGVERVVCLDADTGTEKWDHEYDVVYDISYPAGPRCTPIIEDGRVYTLGAVGHLFCFDLDDGEILWSRDLPVDYSTTPPTWGYAAHPLIDGDLLITLAGGERSHCVALDKRTGDEVWRTLTSSEQGYSPPTMIDFAGVRQLILLYPDALASVDPQTGEPYWSIPYRADSGSIIMSPVLVGDHMYVGGFNNKSLLVRLDSESPGAEEVWRDRRREAISAVNVQPLPDPDSAVIYGADQNGEFRATRLPEGELLWSTTEPISERPARSGTVFFVRQADRYWMFNEQGELIIAELSPEGYVELDRVQVIDPTNFAMGRDVVWSMPAFANRRVYLRNDNEIICIDLEK